MFVRNSLDRFGPTRPVYRFLIVICQNAMLLFKCFCFCLYHRFERIFLSFLWFILMNAQMSTQLFFKSFKSMSCLGRINQFPRNFLCWQAAGCIQIYSFKSMVRILPLVLREKIVKMSKVLKQIHCHLQIDIFESKPD